ncbi:MAG: PAS domain S-box protein [Elusimicrobia bacterium]|nr:PAS domain S-box protein [Elusimicrobiota bacterium]
MKLYARIVLPFVVLMAFLAWAIGVSTRRVVHTVLRSNLENPARDKVASVSHSLRVGLLSGNDRVLRTYLQGCLTGFNALQAAALDRQGRIIAHTDQAMEGKSLRAPHVLASLSSGQASSLETTMDGRPVLELVIPVSPKTGGTEPAGALLLRFSLEKTVETERRIAARVSGSAALAGGACLVALLLLMRSVLAPIRELSLGVEKLGRGEYGTTVPVGAFDEVGDLAGSFNEMSRELAQTTVSKDHLRDILDAMADAVFVTDAQARIQTANPAALAMLGFNEDELAGKPASDLLGPSNDPRLAGKLERVKEGAAVGGSEIYLLDKRGREVPALMSAAPIRSRDDRIKGVVLAVKDIRWIKRNADALRHSEAKLRQSEKLSAVGQLAAGVAHEINNPLGTILGLAQTIARGAPSGAVAAPMKVIEEEALRCRTLVQSLLAFSRQDRPAMEEFDLNEAMEGALGMVEAQARVRGVALARDLGPAEKVWGDRTNIQQVVINLCSNAMDAMPDGGTLTVSTGRAVLNGQMVVNLAVQDTGVGIPEEIRSRVFEPFFTTKKVGAGTGLGLALVHEIVSNHQGSIDLTSEPGKGTVFTVSLPLYDPRAGET